MRASTVGVGNVQPASIVGKTPDEAREAARMDEKHIATLKARCALLGIQLYVTTDADGRPTFVVTKWAMCRELHSVQEVEEFIGLAGGPRA